MLVTSFFLSFLWVPRLDVGAAKGEDPGRRGGGLVPSADVGCSQPGLPLGWPQAARMALAQK